MVSHWSTIGLGSLSKGALLDRLRNEGRSVSSAAGNYYVWEAGGGAEVWLQVDNQGEAVGIDPHFSGSGQALGQVIARHSDSANPLEGWATVQVGQAGAGIDDFLVSVGLDPKSISEVQFEVHVPDFAAESVVDLDRVSMQLAIFAHSLKCFTTPEEHREGSKFALNGGFASGNVLRPPRVTQGLVSGTVLQTDMRTPATTVDSFVWMLIDFRGQTLDVVADPAIIEGDWQIATSIVAEGWFSARLTPP